LIARLFVGASTLAVLFAASAISGYDLSAFAGLTAIAVLLTLLISPRGH
jgi:hypothetical protein